MEPRTFLPIALAGIALAATGCTPVGSNGELGNGTFSYQCDSDSDPVCDDTSGFSGDHVLPGAIAVGARFSLRYTPGVVGDDPGGSTTIESASKDIFTQTETFGSSFKGISPGLGAILARRGDAVADFIHLRVTAIDHVQVDALSGPTSITGEGITELQLAVGDEVTLRALPVDEADEILGGALPAIWSSSDEAVGSFATLATDNEVTLRAEAEGSTKLRIELGEQAAEIAVTVGGAQ